MHEKAHPPVNGSDFWPQEEHNALLDTLPQPQCCKAHQESPPKPAPEQPASDAALSTSNPDVEGDLFAAAATPTAEGQHDESTEDSLQLPLAASAWPDVSELGWFDDPPIGPDNNASIEDIFSELCGRSPSAKDQNAGAQDPTNERTLAIAAVKPPRLLYTPVAMESMLMEYWFSDVCPIWSAYDSPENPHRQLASSAWQQSEAVYYALQSMSAACLVDSLPHLKKHLGVLSSQAVEAIQCGVRAHKQLGLASKFPKELLLAIIAMGTSVCWSDTRQLGVWFLTKAHELLDQYDGRSVQLDGYGQQELDYFREALVYWHMLYRILGSDPGGHLRKRKETYMRRLHHAMSSDHQPSSKSRQDLSNNVPNEFPSKPGKTLALHPWTGISTDIQHTFGLVILLCRDHRLAARKPESRTTAALSDALCDIQMARDLARELREIDVYSDDHAASPNAWSKGTGDSTTPVRHLVDTAEAYRLAALLLLCQTFSDLDMADLGTDSPETANSSQPQQPEDTQHSEAALELAMKLVETLRRVPAESGTRCIQPILYIAAGSGMRFTAIDGESQIPPRDDTYSTETPARPRDSASLGQSAPLDVALLSSAPRPAIIDFKMASVSQCTLQVSRGRRFVIDRLCALQRSLPPRPIGVALDLVKAVWEQYDYGQPGAHWIDVMVDDNRLQTLFG